MSQVTLQKTANDGLTIRFKKKPKKFLAQVQVEELKPKKKKYTIVTQSSTSNEEMQQTPLIEVSETPKIKIKLGQKKKAQPLDKSIELERKPVYDIHRGFMLANSFYSADTGKVGCIDPTNWWHSEKYDGVRVIWDGINFHTRALTVVCAPEEFKAKMPTDLALDGELFIKRNYFNETSGLVRRHNPSMHEWSEIKFMIFDIPNSYERLETRLKHLKKVVKEIGPPLYFVQQTRIHSLQHLEELHARLVTNGAEGSILRMPGSSYIATRTDNILKVKNYDDEDAYILDWDEGHGRNTGKLGALWVRWQDPENIHKKYKTQIVPYVQFRVGSGFKDFDRCDIREASLRYPKNTVIKVGFCGLQNSGKPRHPTFKGIRE